MACCGDHLIIADAAIKAVAVAGGGQVIVTRVTHEASPAGTDADPVVALAAEQLMAGAAGGKKRVVATIAEQPAAVSSRADPVNAVTASQNMKIAGADAQPVVAIAGRQNVAASTVHKQAVAAGPPNQCIRAAGRPQLVVS